MIYGPLKYFPKKEVEIIERRENNLVIKK